MAGVGHAQMHFNDRTDMTGREIIDQLRACVRFYDRKHLLHAHAGAMQCQVRCVNDLEPR